MLFTPGMSTHYRQQIPRLHQLEIAFGSTKLSPLNTTAIYDNLIPVNTNHFDRNSTRPKSRRLLEEIVVHAFKSALPCRAAISANLEVFDTLQGISLA